MDGIVNANEAAAICGVSYATMRAWLKAGKIEGAQRVQRPGEPWNWSIPRNSLDLFIARKRHAGGVDVGAVERLQREIDELKAALRRAQVVKTTSQPSIASQTSLPQAQQSDLALSASPVEQAARDGDLELLPDGWTPLSRWCKKHSAETDRPLHQGSVNREINKYHTMPRPHGKLTGEGPWKVKGQARPVENAWTPEEHIRASRRAQERKRKGREDWQRFQPCPDCADAIEG